MKDALGDRMKSYESANSSVLVPRMPILIRVDGRSFHNYTKGMHCFDSKINRGMNDVARALMQEAQGAIFGYVQSDEFSIVLQTDARTQSQPWFGGKVQKICSIASSVATAAFNSSLLNQDSLRPIENPAMFDARCWNMPWEDVGNYFLWRWRDATRNSVSMYARSMFSHRELHGKSVSEMKDMINYQVSNEEDRDHYGKDTWEELLPRNRQGWFFINDPTLRANMQEVWNGQSLVEFEYNDFDSMLKMVRNKS
jgi:tRNA(His) 5'-end guanylyltransferase